MDHAARRRRLVQRVGDHDVDATLVSRLVNVRYLSGFTGSNGWLLVRGDESGILFTDGRYDGQSRREVPDLDRRIVRSGFGAAFAEACRDAGIRRVAFEAGGMTYRAWKDLEDAGPTLVPLDDEVDGLRWAKDADELRLLERAQGLTDEAFERVVGKLAEGVTERRVAFELEQAMREAGAERVGFDTIVAFGPAAAEPHHRPTDRALDRGDLVKLDFGCVVDGYHSDMTRTVAFGQPDARSREIYEVVHRAHLAGVDAVRTGAGGAAVDAAARTVIAEAGYGDAFGHSVGHGVGLEIHEGPTLRRGSDDVLPAGAVVTVEPGIYLAGMGGVRIEDAVVVEEERGRPLPSTPKELMIL